MSALLSLIIAPTRAWTALYTRGLPADVRGDRREEIDCDLWEHQRLADLEREPVTGTALDMLLRLVLGAPADIFWRLEAGASARSGRGTQMNESKMMRRVFAVCLLLVVLVPVYSLMIVIRNWPNDLGEALAGAAFVTIPLAASIAIVSGLTMTATRPGRAVALVAIGSLVVVVVWFWMFPITIPISIVLVAFTYSRSRRTGWRLRGDRGLPGATA